MSKRTGLFRVYLIILSYPWLLDSTGMGLCRTYKLDVCAPLCVFYCIAIQFFSEDRYRLMGSLIWFLMVKNSLMMFMTIIDISTILCELSVSHISMQYNHY